MPFEEFSPRLCVGCGACALACPTGSIMMQANEEGFLYPRFDPKACVHCGQCADVCQLTAAAAPQEKPAATSYCAIAKDGKIWRRAASGGVSGVIAAHILKEPQSFVCGSVMDAEQQVFHAVITEPEQAERISGSKYVQSDLRQVYAQIRQRLRAGETGVFFGTPCQVAGLKRYLHTTPTDRLYTVDLVCHGVPSPAFWKKAVEAYGGAAVQSVRFRKKTGFPQKLSTFRLQIKRSHGADTELPAKCDAYYNLFMKCQTFRESCYTCPYASLRRCSDLTIGDCDTARSYRSLRGRKAKSIAVIHTEQGQRLWDALCGGLYYTGLDLEAEAQTNHQLRQPSGRPPERDTIYKEIAGSSYGELNRTYAAPYGRKQKLSGFLQDVLPVSVYERFFVRRRKP